MLWSVLHLGWGIRRGGLAGQAILGIELSPGLGIGHHDGTGSGATAPRRATNRTNHPNNEPKNQPSGRCLPLHSAPLRRSAEQAARMRERQEKSEGEQCPQWHEPALQNMPGDSLAGGKNRRAQDKKKPQAFYSSRPPTLGQADPVGPMFSAASFLRNSISGFLLTSSITKNGLPEVTEPSDTRAMEGWSTVASTCRLIEASDRKLGIHSRLDQFPSHFAFEPVALGGDPHIAHAPFARLISQVTSASDRQGRCKLREITAACTSGQATHSRSRNAARWV